MIGTYAAAVAVCLAALALGQAAVSLCGGRRWSWLAPPVGLALLCALCWGTVRLPGHGVISAILVAVLVVLAVAYLARRLEGGGDALREGWPVALAALVAASLPFAAEGHFGILGTSFNPDMSQHLLAADRLAEGHGSELLRQGYPLGPHAVVVALDKGLGVGLVHGFSGLTLAVAVLAPLTALAAFRGLPWFARSAAALVVGLAYLVAAYYAQGAFKETIEALFVLAFALAVRESTRGWAGLPLRFVPAALLGVGAVYVYSFPGLLWLAGTAVVWLLVELALGRRPVEWRSAGLALLVFAIPVAPEIGRMVDFHSFETFDPHGPGLGNLFGQISPFEALGIWPSGDFRLAPGAGAVPAVGYYLGAAFGVVLLGYGLWWCWRRRETAVLAALIACAVAYVAARVGGTPYTAAKAIEIAAPLVALAIVLPLASEIFGREGGEDAATPPSPQGGWGLGKAAAAIVFVLAAGVCSLLALANAPIGPSSYSPALTGFRADVGEGPTLVLASHQLLADEQGTPYISWELRGGRVCIAADGELEAPPHGVRYVVSEGSQREPPFPGLRVKRVAKPYVLWEATGPVAAESPCPLIAVRQARQGPAR
ncbi:MAG: hypothetical protein JST31_13955 [Actinobacteria bacterium]|nr:hypothetical protein [Actinomycetota bacterium]